MITYKKQQSGKYKAQIGEYEIIISKYENKWFADIYCDDQRETTFECRTKKEAQMLVKSYLPEWR